MDKQEIHRAIELIWLQISKINSYFTEEEPWALKIKDPERMESVLYRTVDSIRNLAILTQPVMPDAMDRMLNLLGVPESMRSFAHLGDDFALKPGTRLPAPEAIFPRYQEEA